MGEHGGRACDAYHAATSCGRPRRPPVCPLAINLAASEDDEGTKPQVSPVGHVTIPIRPGQQSGRIPHRAPSSVSRTPPGRSPNVETRRDQLGVVRPVLPTRQASAAVTLVAGRQERKNHPTTGDVEAKADSPTMSSYLKRRRTVRTVPVRTNPHRA